MICCLQGYDTSPSSCPSYTFINIATEPRLNLATTFPVAANNRDLVDLCCTENNSTDACLVTAGGIYLPGINLCLLTATKLLLGQL